MPARELPLPDLERFYDLLAESIDRAGSARDRIFLVKLVLLLANRVADLTALEGFIETAISEGRS